MKPDILNVVRIVRIYWEKWAKSDQCQDIVRFVSNMSGQSQDIWVNLSEKKIIYLNFLMVSNLRV